MCRNQLYILLALLSAAALGWLGYSFAFTTFSTANDFSPCLFKSTTGLPCPACGSTRSLMTLLQGHWQEALFWNPLGFLLFAFLLIVPIWILRDLFVRSDSLFRFYSLTEKTLQKRVVSIPLIALVVANWIWNIVKNN